MPSMNPCLFQDHTPKWMNSAKAIKRYRAHLRVQEEVIEHTGKYFVYDIGENGGRDAEKLQEIAKLPMKAREAIYKYLEDGSTVGWFVLKPMNLGLISDLRMYPTRIRYALMLAKKLSDRWDPNDKKYDDWLERVFVEYLYVLSYPIGRGSANGLKLAQKLVLNEDLGVEGSRKFLSSCCFEIDLSADKVRDKAIDCGVSQRTIKRTNCHLKLKY